MSLKQGIQVESRVERDTQLNQAQELLLASLKIAKLARGCHGVSLLFLGIGFK